MQWCVRLHCGESVLILSITYKENKFILRCKWLNKSWQKKAVLAATTIGAISCCALPLRASAPFFFPRHWGPRGILLELGSPQFWALGHNQPNLQKCHEKANRNPLLLLSICLTKRSLLRRIILCSPVARRNQVWDHSSFPGLAVQINESYTNLAFHRLIGLNKNCSIKEIILAL